MELQEKNWLNIDRERMADFMDKVQTKYKILVTFTQILSKIAILYPINLPTMFTDVWAHFSFLNFDFSVVPMNCVVDSTFHDRLLATTVMPIMFLCGVFVTWLLLRSRLILKGGKTLRSEKSQLTAKAIRLCVIFLFTVFPMVSTTIFQTFQYDTRLDDGSAYLVQDYTIQRDDPGHQEYVVYAIIMAFVYCFGIPFASWCALRLKKDSIQRLQLISESIEELNNGGTPAHMTDQGQGDNIVEKSRRRKSVIQSGVQGDLNKSRRIKSRRSSNGTDLSQVTDLSHAVGGAALVSDLEELQEEMQLNDPWLIGLSPLYQDYNCLYYWFEVPRFVVTLITCGLVTMLPAEGASQVFLSLMVSLFMQLLLANCHPYMNPADGVLAQFCQLVLTFAMAVGIVEMASEEFQDPVFGPLMVGATLTNLSFGVVIILIDFFTSAAPEASEVVLKKATVSNAQKKRTIARETRIVKKKAQRAVNKVRAMNAMVSPASRRQLEPEEGTPAQSSWREAATTTITPVEIETDDIVTPMESVGIVTQIETVEAEGTKIEKLAVEPVLLRSAVETVPPTSGRHGPRKSRASKMNISDL